jgi:Flp pilus assembly protein TadB
MSVIIALSLTVIFAISTGAFLIWRRKKLAEAQEKIRVLNTARDTARIVEEHRRSEVEQSWEEFDRQQWEIRFNEGSVE